MKYIKLILIVFVIASICYIVAKEYAGPFIDHSGEPTQTAVQVDNRANGIIMYYFYGNRRCPTCMAIEKYSKEAAESHMNSGKLNWQTVNVEGVGNKHFIHDFRLPSSGPVLVEYRDGKVMRYRSLDRVWRLVRDKEEFTKYIDEEVNGFIE